MYCIATVVGQLISTCVNRGNLTCCNINIGYFMAATSTRTGIVPMEILDRLVNMFTCVRAQITDNSYITGMFNLSLVSIKRHERQIQKYLAS